MTVLEARKKVAAEGGNVDEYDQGVETAGNAGIAVGTFWVPGPEDIAMAGFLTTKIGGAISRGLAKLGDDLFGAAKNLFSKSDNVIKSFDDLSDVGKLNPNDIRFSQNSIKSTFGDGGNVSDLTKGLKDGSISPDDIPAIRITEKDGKIFTLDNRRLKAFQDAGVEINYKKVDYNKLPKKELDKFTTTNDGTSIKVRGQE